MAAAEPGNAETTTNPEAGSESQPGNEAQPSTTDLPKEVREELETLRRSLQNRTEEAKRHARKLEAFEGVDPEKYREYVEREQKAEEDRLRQEGEFDKMLDAAKQETRTEKERADAIQRSWDEEAIRREILAEAAHLDATKEAREPLTDGGMSQVEKLYVDEFEKVDGKVVHKTLRGDNGRLTVREFLTKQKDGPGGNLFAAGLKPGSGGEGGESVSAGTVTIKRGDPLKATKVQKAVKEGHEINFVD